MSQPTISVSLGRARLPLPLARDLMGLPPGLRGRTMAFLVQAHCAGLDLQKLVGASTELRRLGCLINQSLRCTRGVATDENALREAAKLIDSLRP
jgi:hypothetical protein